MIRLAMIIAAGAAAGSSQEFLPPPPSPRPPRPPAPPPPSSHPPALPPPLDPALQPLLKIDWELLYPLAVGVEDNDGGWYDDSTLVTAFGLSKHSYPGCVNTAYSIM